MAHRVDELPVFLLAREFSVAVTAILEQSTLRRNGVRSGERPLARLAEDENPACEAVRRDAEEDWGKERWR